MLTADVIDNQIVIVNQSDEAVTDEKITETAADPGDAEV
jgi:ATP-dependent Clp protease ATP-binding subunit ClpE